MRNLTRSSERMRQYTFQVLEHCPASKTPQIRDDQQDFSLNDTEVTWWHCPVCQGWHVAMVDRKTD